LTEVIIWSLIPFNIEGLKELALSIGKTLTLHEYGNTIKSRFSINPNLTAGQKTKLANMIKGFTQEYSIT